MKRTLKRFSVIACFTLIAFSSCYLPGSDQSKIKSATTDYVSARLNKGEKYQWGHLERKNGCHYDGKDCKYAEVYYVVTTESGEELEKKLYLLMSEHCDSVYEIAEETDKEWNSKKYPSAEEVKELISNTTKIHFAYFMRHGFG